MSQAASNGMGIESVLITREVDDSMRINSDVLRRMLIRPEIGDKPIAIISIAGCMRTGKSFLLNFFIRYFRERGWKNPDWIKTDGRIGSEGFPWKGGSQRCTKGIRVLGELFEIPVGRNENEKMIVILMDTQGLFDNQTSENVNKTLLTLSTLASSVQIFNSMRDINAQHLEYLKTCVDFALATASDKNAEHYVKLQRLMFLVRDFPENDDFEVPEDFYCFENGEKYLKTILNSKQGGNQQIAVRKRIKESFTDVRCFPLPPPGLKAGKKGFTGKNSELEPDFLISMKTFIEEIASPDRLVPKASEKKYLTGREILNMLATCDVVFAKNLFEATSIMEANEKAYYAAEYEESIAKYDKLLKGNVEANPNMTKEQLMTYHKDSKKIALRRFKSTFPMGTGDYKTKYQTHLEEQCEEHFKLTKERYRARKREEVAKRTKQARNAFSEYKRKMETHSIWALEDDKLELLHKEEYARVRKKYGKIADLDALENKIMNDFQQLREDNKQRREEQKKAMTGGKREKLYKLSAIALKKRCSEEWSKELEFLCNDKDMEEARLRIKDEITEQYWKEALDAVEMKYKNYLDTGLELEFEKAQQVETTLTTYQEKFVYQPGEERYMKTVKGILRKFFEASKEEMRKNGVELFKGRVWFDQTTSKFRREFFNYCSEELVFYYHRLLEVLEYGHKEALNKNEENWVYLETRMKSAVEELILQQEVVLEQIMSDRHIKEDDLKKYFDEAKKHAKENPPDEFVTRIVIERAKLEYWGIINEKMDASYEKIALMNENNKKIRIVTDSSDVPESEGMLKRWWKWLKTKLARSESTS